MRSVPALDTRYTRFVRHLKKKRGKKKRYIIRYIIIPVEFFTVRAKARACYTVRFTLIVFLSVLVVVTIIYCLYLNSSARIARALQIYTYIYIFLLLFSPRRVAAFPDCCITLLDDTRSTFGPVAPSGCLRNSQQFFVRSRISFSRDFYRVFFFFLTHLADRTQKS